MKHSRLIVAFLIAMLAMAVAPAFAQDYGSNDKNDDPVVEVVQTPDWTPIDTPVGYSIFAKAGYAMSTFATQGRGATVLWFSAADVSGCDDVQAYRVTDAGTLSTESWIQKCSVETRKDVVIGYKVELKRTNLPANIIVFVKTKSSAATELEDGDA